MRLLFALLCVSFIMTSQNTNELPYYEIPDAPESYTAGTVAARAIDGLGFRFYWASEGLTEKDLVYKPSEEARTTAETVEHIFGLSKVIVNTALKQPNDFTAPHTKKTHKEMREQTLRYLKKAADILRNHDALEENKMVFKSTNGTREYPFWNLINGPIADAIWHAGQLVSFRRASGNPFNSKASLLTGKVRD